jgi:hypothetical protein
MYHSTTLQRNKGYDNCLLTVLIGLYTDESPGLKVDPVVVLVLSLVFIFSVVALHSKFNVNPRRQLSLNLYSHCEDHTKILELS